MMSGVLDTQDPIVTNRVPMIWSVFTSQSRAGHLLPLESSPQAPFGISVCQDLVRSYLLSEALPSPLPCKRRVLMQFMCLYHSLPLHFEVFGGWRCSRLLLCIPGPHMVLGLGPSEEAGSWGRAGREDKKTRETCQSGAGVFIFGLSDFIAPLKR